MDHNVIYGHVGDPVHRGCWHRTYRVHDIQALDYLPEYSVARAAGILEIQKVVVDEVEEELRCGRVGVGASRHRNRSPKVAQAIIGFKDNGR